MSFEVLRLAVRTARLGTFAAFLLACGADETFAAKVPQSKLDEVFLDCFQGCRADGEDEPLCTKTCRCAIDQISNLFTADEFEKMLDDTARNRMTPADNAKMGKISQACRVKPAPKPVT